MPWELCGRDVFVFVFMLVFLFIARGHECVRARVHARVRVHARARSHVVIATVAVDVRGREHVHACAAYALP